LLVEHGRIPESVATELRRLRPNRIVVLGGELAVKPTVEQQLRQSAPVVERWAAGDRFDLSAEIAEKSFAETADTVFIANGHTMVDALSVGPVAASMGSPVLLVKLDEIPDSVASELARRRPQRIVLLGGPLAVSAS